MFLLLASSIAFFSRSSLAATSPLPTRRVEVGIVARVAAAALAVAAELRMRPSATVKAAVIPGARKSGCAEAVTRQTARVKAIKPITFMAKLLCFCFCDRRK